MNEGVSLKLKLWSSMVWVVSINFGRLELEEKESAVVVSPDRLQLAEKESGFLERVAVRVAEEKGVVFCGREEEKAAEGCGEEEKAEGEGCGRCLVQTRGKEGRR
uniref:Uncharacterized protein n=1 Tax=Salix viminalis TaxID=40686 RepID=A0A6N2KR96_SALVM